MQVLYQYGLLVGLSPVNFFILMRNKDEILTIEDIKEGLEVRMDQCAVYGVA